VSAEKDSPLSIEQLRALFEARAKDELRAADTLVPGADAVATRGALLARIALVKGLPGAAEAAGGAAVSGADGEALSKALESLGWEPGEAFYTLSRPVAGDGDERYARRLRAQIEAVDPGVVVALDGQAAADVSRAFGCETVRAGSPVRVLGRRIVALSGFEAGLGNDRLKRTAWSELKHAAPDGPVF